MGNTNVNGSISMKEKGPEFKYWCKPDGTPFDTLQEAHDGWPYRGFLHKRLVKKPNSNDFDIYAYKGFGSDTANDDISMLVPFGDLVSGISGGQAANKQALQSLVNGSMISAGKIGEVYNKSTWANLNDFTYTGFTPTLDVNGHIVITGGGNNYDQFMRIKEYDLTQADPNMTIEVTYTLTEAGAQGGNGLAVGKKSIDGASGANWKIDILAQYKPSGPTFLLKKGSVVNYPSDTITSGTSPAYNEGDSVTIAYKQQRNKLSILVNGAPITTFTDPLVDGGNMGGFQAIPNTSTPTIWNCLRSDEIITITNIRISSDTYQGGVAMFEDSKGLYYHNGFANTPGAVLGSIIGLPVYAFTGSGDTVSSVIRSMPYIQNQLKPIIVVLNIGRNSPTDARDNYAEMFNGIKVVTQEGRIIGCHGVPETGGHDQSLVNTAVDTYCLTENVIDWGADYIANLSTFISADMIHEDGDGGGPFRGNVLGNYFLSRTF